MITHNEIVMRASAERCFQVAADVERWPEILSHYRWVRFRRRDDFGFGLVEMGIFLLVLLLGYYYAWKKRALEWV